ncbi:MAG: hypothetical protein ABWY78_06115 [Microvirga sp.]
MISLRTYLIAGVAALGFAGAVQAQTPPPASQVPPPSATQSQATDPAARDVTSTGATVPNPGTEKIGPQTEVERRAQERSDKATKGICSGCQ